MQSSYIFTEKQNVCGTLQNHENRKSLAQQIFPHLQYITDTVQFTH